VATKQDRYTLIILDDEYLARHGLETLVDWNRLGIDVVATASNGVDGLELIREYRPDLVMTDIRMPGMNGLAFVEQASAIAPGTVYIVFSGFSEFTYAKEAMSLGVIEYLEKPITVDKVESIMPKALKRIEYRREHQALESIRLKAQHGIIDNAILYMLAEKELDVPRLEKALTEIDANLFRYPYISLCMVAIDCADDVVEVVRKNLMELFYRPSLPAYSIFPLVHQGACIVLVFSTRTDTLDMLDTRLQDLDDMLGGHHVFAGMSTVGGKFDDLATLLQEAERALAAASSENSSSFVHIQDVPAQPEIPFFVEVEKDVILLHFRQQERALYLQSLQRYCSQLRAGEVRGSVIYNELNELFYLCIKIAQEMGNTQIISELDEIAFPDSYMKFVFSTVFLRKAIAAFERLFDFAFKETGFYTHKAILRLKEYIDKNHHRKDISLQMLSELSSLSTAYISKLFKKEIGMNYLDYLTTVRLEHSKILLTQGNKVSVVSDRVGYGNYRTFCLLFKKAYGMTPSAFTRVSKSQPI
jgi:two-component system, response regulator YesN